ncbi:MAG: tRNA lysidine(34) synthetase TilS [bacterium]
MNRTLRHTLLQRIRKLVKEYRILERGDNVLVALSGGPDSVALLHLLRALQKEYELTLVLAHLEHGIRGKESHEQAGFVQQIGRKMGLNCFIRHMDVPLLKRMSGLSLEEAAREARYQFFREMAKRAGSTKIALGHTADDQAETLLMRLLRGAGLDGLAAMRPRRYEEIPLIRPLLNVFRREILDFLHEEKIPFCLDSTNQESDYLRNRIRLHLIPMLRREYNPQIGSVLHQTASILGEEREWVSSLVREKLEQCLETRKGKKMRLGLNSFLAMPLALQREVLREAVHEVTSDPYKIGFVKVSAVLQWLNESRWGCLHLSRNVCIQKRAGSFCIEEKEPEPEISPRDFHYRLNIPGDTLIQELNLTVSTRILNDWVTGCSRFEAEKAYLDFDALTLPLFIRKRQPKDRFHPLGGPGHKKLKEFFIDDKIPRLEREKIPVVASGHEVVWVFARRVAEPFKITERTRRVLLIEKRI